MRPSPGIKCASFEDLPSSREAWLAVEEAAGASIYPFQRYAWMELWQETIGTARGYRPAVLLLEREDGKGRALLPLGIRKSRGLKRLEWLGAGVSDYAGPLVAGSFPSGALLAAILRAGRRNACDVVSLDRVPALLADRSPNPLAAPPLRKLHYAAHGLALPRDAEAFFGERFSSKERYNARRAEKKLSELGPLEFRVVRDEDERHRLTRAMIEQKRERYRATGAVDNFRETAVARFYLEAARRPGLGVELSALYLDGEPIATHWGLADGRVLYFLMPTFAAGDLARHSPGKLFLFRFISRCVADGFWRLDFTIGDEDYKTKWCSDETALYGYVRGLSSLGRLESGIARIAARAKEGPLLEWGRWVKKALHSRR